MFLFIDTLLSNTKLYLMLHIIYVIFITAHLSQQLVKKAISLIIIEMYKKKNEISLCLIL